MKNATRAAIDGETRRKRSCTPRARLSASVAAMSSDTDSNITPSRAAKNIPSWTRLDLAARLVQRLSASTLTWRLGLDNATDRRAWRESPFQFGHVYLYPLAPRTWRASLTAAY